MLQTSPAYRLAVHDPDFLLREEMRAMRFALEFQKVDLGMRDWQIDSTVTVLGSARILPPETASAALAEAEAAGADAKTLSAARKRVELSAWYQVARDFGRIVAERGGSAKAYGRRSNVILTGGGPGIMEAANRGAFDAGAPNVGMTIQLEHEDHANEYITPDLAFRFHYFHMRKFQMFMRASGIAVFPGGYGSIEEAFEAMTLLQCHKSHAFPLVLFGRAWWERLINVAFLAEEGLISPPDLNLFTWAETAEEGWAQMVRGGLHVPD